MCQQTVESSQGMVVKCTAVMFLPYGGLKLSCLRLYVYTIPDSSCAGNRNTSERAFLRTQDTDFESIFVPERCFAASVLKVNRHISDRFS